MPTKSVDRTRSSRFRAGSRRNKKLKNVKTFKSDRVKMIWTISNVSFYKLPQEA